MKRRTNRQLAREVARYVDEHGALTDARIGELVKFTNGRYDKRAKKLNPILNKMGYDRVKYRGTCRTFSMDSREYQKTKGFR